ncbi:hypothetical protein HDE_11070 [Halotydeus destructor]|nr:hypothetical protein HDE_11070 [Halotydeus destructor]
MADLGVLCCLGMSMVTLWSLVGGLDLSKVVPSVEQGLTHILIVTLVEVFMVYTTASLFYAAILIFALSQFALLLLGRQVLRKIGKRPRNGFSTIDDIRRDNKQLLNCHKMAADCLGIVVDHLTAILFIDLALHLDDHLTKSPKSQIGAAWFIASDLGSLLAMLVAMSVMAAYVHRQYLEYHREALKFAEPDPDDESKDLVLSKVSLMTDLVANQVKPMLVLDLLEFDLSFPVKFLASLIPFTTMVVTPLVPEREL